jgi:DNA-binding protein HU-beta
MYKAELIRTMVKKAEEKSKMTLSAKQMDAALSALMESVKDALKSGEKVVLPGFGMFAVKTRPARQGRNPLTGEVMAIPERKMPAFKAGKTLKDAVAGE